MQNEKLWLRVGAIFSLVSRWWWKTCEQKQKLEALCCWMNVTIFGRMTMYGSLLARCLKTIFHCVCVCSICNMVLVMIMMTVQMFGWRFFFSFVCFSIYLDPNGMEMAHGSMVCCLSMNFATMTNTLAMCPFYAQLGRLQMYRIQITRWRTNR